MDRFVRAQLIDNFVGRQLGSRVSKRSARSWKTTLRTEPLEDRCLMTVAPPTAGLVLSLGADANLSVNSANVVTQWADETTDANWISDAVGSPTLTTATFGNGPHSVIHFGGNNANGNQTPDTGDGLTLLNTADLQLSSLSVYVVGDVDSGAEGQDFVINFDNHTGASYGWALGTSDSHAQQVKFFTASGSDTLSDTTGNSLDANQYYIIGGSYLAGSSSGTKSAYTSADGTNVTGSTPGSSSVAPIDYGSDNTFTASLGYLRSVDNPLTQQFLTGDIAEVLIYDDSGLTPTQLAEQDSAVNAYLNSKYFALPANLAIESTHSGTFQQGDTSSANDRYALAVTNTGGTPTTGTVTVVDAVPNGLTPLSASGTGWTTSISGQTVTATRTDSLAAGSSYPSLSITVGVASDAPSAVTNSGTVSWSGQGSTPSTFSDLTAVLHAPSSFAEDVIDGGALAFWPLNDISTADGATAVSLVNPGTYNGYYQNGVTSGPAAFPAMGSAAYFHNTAFNSTLASADAVITPNTGLPIGSSDRTILLWAKEETFLPDSYYHAETEYGKPGTPTSSLSTSIFGSNDSNSMPGGMAVSQWGDGVGSTTSFVDGQWHFFAVTISGGGGAPTYRIYADGALENTKSMATNTILGLANTIGANARIDPAGLHIVGWNGGIGDVAIFGTALTGAQISRLYADAANASTIAPANNQPTLALIAGQTVHAGDTVSFTAQASDLDVGQSLTYSLASGAPSSAYIDPNTGQFSWTLPESQTPGTYSVTVTATDNGSPPLSASQVVSIDVLPAALAKLAINGPTSVNASSVVFPVILQSASDQTITVNYSTADATSGATDGYTPITGTLTFAPGVTSQNITVALTGNSTPAADETFYVDLTSPTNAILVNAQATGTIAAKIIVDEDSPDSVVSLAKLFGDPQAGAPGPITSYTVSTDNSALLVPTVFGSVLNLHYQTSQTGSANVTVTAHLAVGINLQKQLAVQVNSIDLAPTIGSLTTNVPNVVSGNSFTLTASQLTDPNSDVTGVAFYRDVNGTGILDTDHDQLLGNGTYSSTTGAWTLSVSTSLLPPGAQIYFAQAIRSDGSKGPAAVVTGTIESAVPVLDPLPTQHVPVAGSFVLRASAYTPDPTSQLTYAATLFGPGLSSGGQTMTSVGSSIFEGQLPGTSAEGDNYTVVITAHDQFGRQAQSITTTVAATSTQSTSPLRTQGAEFSGFDEGDGGNSGVSTVGSGTPTNADNTWCGCQGGMQTGYNPQTGNLLLQLALGANGPITPIQNLLYNSNFDPPAIVSTDVALWNQSVSEFQAQLKLYDHDGNVVNPDDSAVSYALQGTGNAFHIALQTDASSLATGRYRYEIDFFAPGSTTGTPEYHVSGYTIVVNQTDSHDGNRWNLDGQDQLFIQTDDSDPANANNGALLVTGQGATYWLPGSNTSGFATDLADNDLASLTYSSSTGAYTLTSKDSSREVFNGNGLQTDSYDAFGNRTQYSYATTTLLDQWSTPASGYELSTITDWAGRVTNFSYTDGMLTSITDIVGRTTTLHYDSLTIDSGETLQVLTSIVEPPAVAGDSSTSATATFQYDPHTGAVTRAVGPDGQVQNFQYDEAQRLKRISGGDGTQTVLLTASAEQGLALALPGLGTSDNPLPLNLANGSSNAYGYMVDQNNQITTFTTDSRGDQTSSTDPLGNTTTWTFNTASQPIKQVQPSPDGVAPNIITGYQYDSRGNLIEIDDLNTDGSVKEVLQQYQYDATFNQVTKSTDLYGAVTDYVLGSHGEVTSQIQESPTGNLTTSFTYTTANQYTPAGLLHSVTDPAGRTTTDTYWQTQGKAGLLQTETLQGSSSQPGTMVTSYNYDSLGNLVSYIDETGPITYGYDNVGRLTSATVPAPGGPGLSASQTNYYAYDVQGHLISTTAPDGSVTQYRYRVGLVTQEIDPNPDRTGAIAPPETIYTYTKDRQVASVTDPNGHTTTYQYDALGRLTSQAFPEDDNGNTPVIQYVYDNLSQVSKVIDANGNATRYSYDDLGRVTDVLEPSPTDPLRGNGPTSPSGRSIFYLYTDHAGSGAHSVTVYDDPTFVEHTSTFDASKYTTTTYAYNALGQLSSVTYPRISTAGSLPATEEFTYDNAGNLVQDVLLQHYFGPILQSIGSHSPGIVSAIAAKSTYTYDFRDRVLTQADQSGATTSFSYRNSSGDDTDQLQSVTDPLGQTTTYHYDNVGRLQTVTAPVPAVGQVAPQTTYYYDLAGNAIGTSDAMNHTSVSTYDSLGRVLTDTDADGNTTRYGYDLASNVTSLTDPVGNTTTYQYDALNQATHRTNALGYSDIYRYDANGNVASHTDRDGRTTVYSYDDLNRLTAENWLDTSGLSTETLAYSYDPDGNLLSATDTSASAGVLSTVAYGDYNAFGQANDETQSSVGAPTVALDNIYNSIGQRSELIASIGSARDFTNAYRYDTSGRMTSVSQSSTWSDGANRVAGKDVTFGYNADSQLTSIDRYDSDLPYRQFVVHTDYGYDHAGRLTNIADTANAGVKVDNFAYTYDAANRVTSLTTSPAAANALAGDGSTVYGYDPAGQLSYASQTNLAQTVVSSITLYHYDANGNRTSVVTAAPGETATTVSYTTGTDNELASDGTSTFQYDHEGNLSRKTDIATGAYTLYAYDYRNRLTTVTDYDATDDLQTQTNYSYDALDRRIAEREVGPTGAVILEQHFAYDGNQIVLQFNGSGQLTDRYLYGAVVDQVLADEHYSSPSSAPTTAGTVLFPLDDMLGSVRDLVDATGAVVDHLNYDAYGQMTQTAPTTDYLFGYTGFVRDLSTGDFLSESRSYSPVDGRWRQQDPSGFGGGQVNLSAYVDNASTLFTDPTGRDEVDDILKQANLELGRLVGNGVMSRDESLLREANIRNALKAEFGFGSDRSAWRNPEFWTDGRAPGGRPTDAPFTVRPGKTAAAAISDMWHTHDRKPETGCLQAKDLIQLKAIIDRARARDQMRLNSNAITSFNRAVGTNAPSDVARQYERRVEDPRGLDPRTFLPGDAVKFTNPGFARLNDRLQRSFAGEEGSNVIFLGGGRYKSSLDGSIQTMSDIQQKVSEYETFPLGRTPDDVLPTRVTSPMLPDFLR